MPHAQRFAENEHITGSGVAVALQVLRVDEADGHQPVDGFDRVDGVAAGQRNAGVAADALAAFEDAGDGFVRQHVDGHATMASAISGLPPMA